MQDDMLRDLTFEDKIKDFTPEGKFLAKQMYDQCERCEGHEDRLKHLESRDQKTFALTGGLGGAVGVIIGALGDYLRTHVS